MANKTKCLTPDAHFSTVVMGGNYEGQEYVSVRVQVPPGVLKHLDSEEAELLETLLHNQVELVLRPYFIMAESNKEKHNEISNSLNRR